MRRLKIYLAGPEVFLPEAISIGSTKKRMCDEFGFQGLFPFDNEIDHPSAAEQSSIDAQIFAANMEMIRLADFGIFNLTPFRGVSADVGTVFEMGAFVGQRKPIFAYTNVTKHLLERVGKVFPLKQDESGVWRDDHLMSVEDFANSDNLMIDKSLASQGRLLHCKDISESERFTDLGGFRECLLEARKEFDPKPSATRRQAIA